MAHAPPVARRPDQHPYPPVSAGLSPSVERLLAFFAPETHRLSWQATEDPQAALEAAMRGANSRALQCFVTRTPRLIIDLGSLLNALYTPSVAAALSHAFIHSTPPSAAAELTPAGSALVSALRESFPHFLCFACADWPDAAVRLCVIYFTAHVFPAWQCAHACGVDAFMLYQAVGPRKHIRVAVQGRRSTLFDTLALVLDDCIEEWRPCDQCCVVPLHLLAQRASIVAACLTAVRNMSLVGYYMGDLALALRLFLGGPLPQPIVEPHLIPPPPAEAAVLNLVLDIDGTLLDVDRNSPTLAVDASYSVSHYKGTSVVGNCALRPGIVQVLQDLRGKYRFFLATAAMGRHPFKVHALLSQIVGAHWHCLRIVDQTEFLQTGSRPDSSGAGLASLKRLATVVGAGEVTRSVILDDVPAAWQPEDRPRVIVVEQFLFHHSADKVHTKRHEKYAAALRGHLEKLHALYVASGATCVTRADVGLLLPRIKGLGTAAPPYSAGAMPHKVAAALTTSTAAPVIATPATTTSVAAGVARAGGAAVSVKVSTGGSRPPPPPAGRAAAASTPPLGSAL